MRCRWLVISVRKHRAPKGALRRSDIRIKELVDDLARKHRAPKGALRPVRLQSSRVVECQKAPSAKRCIKTAQRDRARGVCCRQKEPSAKRCIKTLLSGAFRGPCRRSESTKHQKGALRPLTLEDIDLAVTRRHTAPSAKRCIKTGWGRSRWTSRWRVRKHRAPKGALRLPLRYSSDHLNNVRKH